MSKRQIYEKSNGRCWYCSVELPTEVSGWHCDHQLPKSRGGSDNLDNLVAACARCNIRKRNRTVEEFRHYLQRITENLITDASEHAFELAIGCDDQNKVLLTTIGEDLQAIAERATDVKVIFYGERL